MEGKVRAALQLIAKDNSGGPLPLDKAVSLTDSSPSSSTPPEMVREVLLKKHPSPQPPKQSSIVTPDSSTTNPHPILFDRLDGQLIRSTALRMDGAAGPSGLDAAAWKRLCTSFKAASTELCDALASTARRICTNFVDPSGVSAFVACCLVALDKCPGIRQIGIGETARRIIGKAIATIISDDIQDATGPHQVCAGQLAGCEAAVCAMPQVFQSPESEAIILVDASNAFNSLNRQTALYYIILHLCHALYIQGPDQHIQRRNTSLIDGETLLSQEGTTQGDLLAMAMYAVASTPLIHHLEDKEVKQVWFADDATAGGSLAHLRGRAWWDCIIEPGPDYGYYPNASKTWLIVKEDKVREATAHFQGTGVSVNVEGKRHLRAAIGTPSFVESYVQKKIDAWTQELDHLSSIASTQPYAAYTAFAHGLATRRVGNDISSQSRSLNGFWPVREGRNCCRLACSSG